MIARIPLALVTADLRGSKTLGKTGIFKSGVAKGDEGTIITSDHTRRRREWRAGVLQMGSGK